MNDKEFTELELRATICPAQCEWPKSAYGQWQRLHAVPDEARERVRKASTRMDEIDGNDDLSREEKQHQRCEVSDQALAEFEASKTLMRAREAVRYGASPAMLKAVEQAGRAGRGRWTRSRSVPVEPKLPIRGDESFASCAWVRSRTV
jgi:hypothetical protein